MLCMKYTIDLFLLDIILDPQSRGCDMSGAEFAQKVRNISQYYFTPIIFVTSLYDTKSYMYSETHCFHYIEKPFDVVKTKAVLKEALKFSTKAVNDAKWFYHLDGMVGAVPIRDIIYAHSKNREAEVITIKEKIQVGYKSCRDLLDELDSDDFMQCSRGTIVNRRYIKRVDSVNRFVYLYDCEDVLEIGPVKKKEFMDWYNLEG